MKWAPNKRLHFEVAVIKAIQTLSQVTLNEVIENLAALRDSPEGHASAGSGRAEARPSEARPGFTASSPSGRTASKAEAPRAAEPARSYETKAPP